MTCNVYFSLSVYIDKLVHICMYVHRLQIVSCFFSAWAKFKNPDVRIFWGQNSVRLMAWVPLVLIGIARFTKALGLNICIQYVRDAYCVNWILFSFIAWPVNSVHFPESASRILAKRQRLARSWRKITSSISIPSTGVGNKQSSNLLQRALTAGRVSTLSSTRWGNSYRDRRSCSHNLFKFFFP